MSTEPAPAAPAAPEPNSLDFWSFIDHAIRRVPAEVPTVDPQAMRLVLTLYRASNLITYDLESTVHRPRGWTFPGFRLLFVIWLAGPLESKQAAQLSGMSRAAVSALVNTLVKAGLVSRVPADYDRRTVQLSLTDQGREAITQAFGAHNDREHAWSKALTDEESHQLVHLLDKLITHSVTAAVKIRR